MPKDGFLLSPRESRVSDHLRRIHAVSGQAHVRWRSMDMSQVIGLICSRTCCKSSGGIIMYPFTWPHKCTKWHLDAIKLRFTVQRAIPITLVTCMRIEILNIWPKKFFAKKRFNIIRPYSLLFSLCLELTKARLKNDNYYSHVILLKNI